MAADTDNLYIGKGEVFWTKDGEAERSLGNSPQFVLTPTKETLDHYSSLSGVKSKDRTITLSKSVEMRVTLEEFTPENLAMLLFGAVDTDTAGNSYFNIFSESELTGSIRFQGANDVGNQFEVLLPSVSINPQSAVPFISEELASVELVAEVLISGSSFGTITQTTPASA